MFCKDFLSDASIISAMSHFPDIKKRDNYFLIMIRKNLYISLTQEHPTPEAE